MRRLLLAGVLALVGFEAEAQQADTHAIVGARVITVSGPVYERATVVMRDGLITAVGPDVAAPPGARVIDGKGLVVTPGLVDGLSSIGLPGPARGAAGSGTSGAGAAAAPSSPPLAPQALALDRVKVADVAKARDGGVTTALVIPREGVLPGQSVLLNLAGDKPEAMVLREPAALHLHLASLARQYPGSLMGTLAYARQALYDAARAREVWAAWEKAPRGQKRPRYDPALAPWQQVLAGKLPLVVTCTLENDVRRALALADEFKLQVVLAGRTARLPLGRAPEGSPRAAPRQRQLRPAAGREHLRGLRRGAGAAPDPGRGAQPRRAREGGRAVRARLGLGARLRRGHPQGRSRRASRPTRRCVRRRSARPRCSRSKAPPAASSPASSRTWSPGPASPSRRTRSRATYSWTGSSTRSKKKTRRTPASARRAPAPRPAARPRRARRPTRTRRCRRCRSRHRPSRPARPLRSRVPRS